jgi:putative endonuclease
MSDPRHTLGATGEQIAAAHLERAGWTILARNWRHSTYGELDIIARDGDELVFVEVRTRRGPLRPAIDAALTSITPQKRARLLKLAQAYRAAHDLDRVLWRVDVVAIAVQGRHHQLEVIRDALGW